jgi:hypothetical protein
MRNLWMRRLRPDRRHPREVKSEGSVTVTSTKMTSLASGRSLSSMICRSFWLQLMWRLRIRQRPEPATSRSFARPMLGRSGRC